MSRLGGALRAHRILVVTAVAYYVGFVALGLVTRNGQTGFYAAFVAAAIAGVAWQEARVHFTQVVLWGLAAWGALHMAGGLVPATGDRVLYNVWLLPFVRFDHVVHALGFGFAGLAFWESVQPAVDTRIRSGGTLVLAGGLAFGALNEMIEFLITRVVADTNIGGFENTGWDLVANTAGATCAALWVHLRRGSRAGESTTEPRRAPA